MEAVINSATGFRGHSTSAPLCGSSQALPALCGIFNGQTIMFTETLNNTIPPPIQAKQTLPMRKADRGAGSLPINLMSLADPRFSPRSGDVFKSMNFIQPRPQPARARAVALVDAEAQAPAQFLAWIVAPLDAFGFHELISRSGAARGIDAAPPKPQAPRKQVATSHVCERSATLDTRLSAEASGTPALLSWIALSRVAPAME